MNASDIPVQIIPDLHVTVPPGLSKRGLTRWVCCGLGFQAASATIFACALKVQTPRSLCQKLKFQVNLINLFILHYRILWFALCITLRIGSFVNKIIWSPSPVSHPWPKWESFTLALWFILSEKNFWGKKLYHEDFTHKNCRVTNMGKTISVHIRIDHMPPAGILTIFYYYFFGTEFIAFLCIWKNTCTQAMNICSVFVKDHSVAWRSGFRVSASTHVHTRIAVFLFSKNTIKQVMWWVNQF